jgi:hypothetical protein
MNNYLANALRSPQDEWVAKAFYEDFQSATQWRDYLVNHFMEGEELDVGTILDKEREWHAIDFQALYVACWTYKPVVKGSYMLCVTDFQRNVRRGYKKLSSRWTSHLHTEDKGGVGSEGWRFLKGYHELLVQMEEANYEHYLFLKCEGFPSISVPHIKSYIHKRTHGVGKDVNEDLLTIASDEDTNVGINVRRAENYSPLYKALIQELGKKKFIKKHGEIVNVREVAAMLVNVALETGRMVGEEHDIWLMERLRRSGVDGNIDEDHFTGAHNGTIAYVLETIIAFAFRVTPALRGGLGPHRWIGALVSAQRDIESVIAQLRKDQQRGNTTTVRYFEEVVVTREQVNRGLAKAFRLLSMPKRSCNASGSAAIVHDVRMASPRTDLTRCSPACASRRMVSKAVVVRRCDLFSYWDLAIFFEQPLKRERIIEHTFKEMSNGRRCRIRR